MKEGYTSFSYCFFRQNEVLDNLGVLYFSLCFTQQTATA